jgi:hypothetical protein
VIDSLKPKRLFLGKKLSNKNLEGQLLPKTIAAIQGANAKKLLPPRVRIIKSSCGP